MEHEIRLAEIEFFYVEHHPAFQKHILCKKSSLWTLKTLNLCFFSQFQYKLQITRILNLLKILEHLR